MLSDSTDHSTSHKTIDLHTHSDMSDGTLTPSELVKAAHAEGICAIALTDHDTVKGIDEALAAGKEFGVEVIAGVEFSAYYGCELHIIGLFIDHKSKELIKTLSFLNENRKNRNLLIIEQLAKLGFKIDLNELPPEDGKTITRAHFARLLVEKGYCSNISEAYNKYIGFGKPAYVPSDRLTPDECIKLIHRAGGLAFLAHLNQINVDDSSDLINLVSDLKEIGLDGLEGYYFEYDEEWEQTCEELAEIFDLAVCGGSDFHGDNKKNELGKIGDDKTIDYLMLKKLKKRLEPIDIEDIV